MGLFLSLQNSLEVPGVTLSSFIRSAVELKTGKRIFAYVQKKEFELTKRAMEGLGALPHVHILGSKDTANHTGIVSFTIDDVHPHDVSEILSSDGMMCVPAITVRSRCWNILVSGVQQEPA